MPYPHFSSPYEAVLYLEKEKETGKETTSCAFSEGKQEKTVTRTEKITNVQSLMDKQKKLLEEKQKKLITEKEQKYIENAKKEGLLDIDKFMKFREKMLTTTTPTLTLQDIQTQIKQLRESSADYSYMDEKGKKILIKCNSDAKQGSLHPIDPNEAYIQGLRYFQGMLLIVKHHPLNEEAKQQLAKEANAAFLSYQEKMQGKNLPEQKTNNTLELIANFERLLSQHMKFKKNYKDYLLMGDTHKKMLMARAHKNLLMARDIGVLLEDHDSIVTISKYPSQDPKMPDSVTIEKSENFRVSEQFYDGELNPETIKYEEWFIKAQKKTKLEKGNNWMSHFFSAEDNFKRLKEMGVTAPPSARWLPLPANSQNVSLSRGTLDKSGTIKLEDQTKFYRTGTTTSFQLEDSVEETRLSKVQLKEMIRGRLNHAIQEYKEKYATPPAENSENPDKNNQESKKVYENGENKPETNQQQVEAAARIAKEYKSLAPRNENGKMDFYISYEHLLSPFLYEEYGRWTDNNGKFSKMAKEAMQEIAQEYMEAQENVQGQEDVQGQEGVQDQENVQGQEGVQDQEDVQAQKKSASSQPTDVEKKHSAEAITPPSPIQSPASSTRNTIYTPITVDKDISLHFLYTNAAVNKISDTLPTKIQVSTEDFHPARYEKIHATAALVDNLIKELENSKAEESKETKQNLELIKNILKGGPSCSPGMFEEKIKQIEETFPFAKSDNNVQKNEIIRRIRASFYLNALLHNRSPYKDIKNYQRNIMMTALEFHAIGSQSLSLAGCKSARDRTAVFGGAVKIMLEDPTAMNNWNKVENGIILSLLQGHHFRSMNWHNAIVKVNDVHSDLMELLPKEVQVEIKALLRYGKSLKSSKTMENKLINELKEMHRSYGKKGDKTKAASLKNLLEEAEKCHNFFELNEVERKYRTLFKKEGSFSSKSEKLHSQHLDRLTRGSVSQTGIDKHIEEGKQFIHLLRIEVLEKDKEKDDNRLTILSKLFSTLNAIWEQEIKSLNEKSAPASDYQEAKHKFQKMIDVYKDVLLIRKNHADQIASNSQGLGFFGTSFLGKKLNGNTMNPAKKTALDTMEENIINALNQENISSGKLYKEIHNHLCKARDQGKQLARFYSRSGGNFSKSINNVIKNHQALLSQPSKNSPKKVKVVKSAIRPSRFSPK